MVVSFVHDGPLQVNDAGQYFNNCFTNDVFNRYFKIADKINIGMRVETAKNISGLSVITLDNINIYTIPNVSSLRGIILDRKKAEQEIAKLIKETDGLIIRLPSILGIIAVKYAKRYNKPFLVELVGCPWDSLWNHSLRGKIVAPYMYFATRKAVKDASFVLYVTNEFLQSRYPNNFNNIGCSDVAIDDLNESILEMRQNKILEDNPEIEIGTIGAINVVYKGQDLVIKAIAKLNKQGYNFKYRLVGGGDSTYLKSIAEKYGVADKVIFEGTLPHEKVFDFLNEIDIYVQPSYTEGLPRALIEAMSRACPSIGSNAGGIPELIDNEYIFQRGSVSDLIGVLKSFDKEKMIQQANRNFEFSKRFTKEVLDERRNEFLLSFRENINIKY